MKTVCLFAIFAFCQAAVHYPIDQAVDRVLPVVNSFIQSNGWENITLPDYGMPATPVFIDVSMANLSQIIRSGECEMWGEGETTLNLKLNLGLEDMKIDVHLVPIMHAPMTIKTTGANVELGVSFYKEGTYPNTDCGTIWGYLNITTLGNITIHTPNQDFDGKPAPQEVLPPIMDYYNNLFNGDGEYSVRNLNGKVDLCNIPDVTKRIVKLLRN